MEIYRNEIFKVISWNQNKQTKTCLQKLKDSFEKMDTYMKCYRQHIHHFKGGFRYVSAQSFNEGEINMETTNDPSDRVGN